jgi:protein O-GlcNAc transferase
MSLLHLKSILKDTKPTDYLLLDSNPRVSRKAYIETLIELCDIYKSLMKTDTNNFVNHCNEFIKYHYTILNVDFENEYSKKELCDIYNSLCDHASKNDNIKLALDYLQTALQVDPVNYIVHSNLGFIYKTMNEFRLSVMHYKQSIFFNKSDNSVKVMAYSGLSCNFRSIQNWAIALHYLLKAYSIDSKNFEILNSLGVVYTEMRRTDIAEKHYLEAITAANNDPTLLENVYLNYGHMHFTNGDNIKSIELYNTALKYDNKSKFAFQNKLMNLVYLQDLFTDSFYIYRQHLLINKLFIKDKKRIENNFPKSNGIINVGFISGDFVEHPVGYFISTFLQNYDKQKFKVICYSECLIKTESMGMDIEFTLIRGMDTDNVCNLIKKDKIHILFDLSGHTGFNRIDVFAKKPADIQISYIGYPYTTGLTEMDYRITDTICDNEDSQKHYTEKLLYLKDCFLCYNPVVTLPKILPKRNKKFTIGCFNRLNKISESMILLINDILNMYPDVYFIFKTKALLNNSVKGKFLQNFKCIDRINILECGILHTDHLSQYNYIDISLDTFPYSGTTTSCESLVMGVPVLSLYDTVNYFHASNVTVSILKNSNLSDYICYSKLEIINKIGKIKDSVIDKNNIRNTFLNNKVCDTKKYMKNFQELLLSL